MEKKSFRNLEAYTLRSTISYILCWQEQFWSIHDAHECEAKVDSIKMSHSSHALSRLDLPGRAVSYFHHGSARRSKHIWMMCSLASVLFKLVALSEFDLQSTSNFHVEGVQLNWLIFQCLTSQMFHDAGKLLVWIQSCIHGMFKPYAACANRNSLHIVFIMISFICM